MPIRRIAFLLGVLATVLTFVALTDEKTWNDHSTNPVANAQTASDGAAAYCATPCDIASMFWHAR